MDPRLLQAAQKGDVGLLNDLIRSNSLILEEAALQGAGNTPLHVACVAGHSNFVRELLKLMPKLAEEVNADGFSPLHIAAARGDVETVREILKTGWPQHLCLVKGRERRIPLHGAAANGKVTAMKELLSASPESVEERTAREETALHLSVKNNRFDALVVLVEHLKQHNKERVINWKDKNGDTILHLAAVTSNFEVVCFLLSGHALNCKFVEVNALNKSGSTALDVLPCSDRESREILMQAGAQHGQSNLPSSQIILVDDKEGQKSPDSRSNLPSSQIILVDDKEGQKSPDSQSNLPSSHVEGQKSSDDVRSDLLVVAGLIATTTFQVVIQPITLFKKVEFHTKNKILAAYLSWGFGSTLVSSNLNLGSFLITNTIGFLSSVLMICRLTKRVPWRLPLLYSMYSMVSTYVSCLGNVPSRSLRDEHYSPLGDILITSLATVIPAVLVLTEAWQQKLLDWTLERIARAGSPQSGPCAALAKMLFTILTWLGLVAAPGIESLNNAGCQSDSDYP